MNNKLESHNQIHHQYQSPVHEEFEYELHPDTVLIHDRPISFSDKVKYFFIVNINSIKTTKLLSCFKGQQVISESDTDKVTV